MSASMQCPHSDIHYDLNNHHFGDTNLHYLEVKAKCNICGKPMQFRGPVGVSPSHPTIDLMGETVSIPFIAEGEEITGKAIGYSVTAIPGGGT